MIPLTNEFNVAFRAFDIHVPELGIRDIQFLPSPGQTIRFVILYEHHGKKHLKLYALDASNKQIIDQSPLLSNVSLPDSTCAIIPSGGFRTISHAAPLQSHVIVCASAQLQLVQ